MLLLKFPTATLYQGVSILMPCTVYIHSFLPECWPYNEETDSGAHKCVYTFSTQPK